MPSLSLANKRVGYVIACRVCFDQPQFYGVNPIGKNFGRRGEHLIPLFDERILEKSNSAIDDGDSSY